MSGAAGLAGLTILNERLLALGRFGWPNEVGHHLGQPLWVQEVCGLQRCIREVQDGACGKREGGREGGVK